MAAGDSPPPASEAARDRTRRVVNTRQLLLSIDLPVWRTFANFVVAPQNREIVEHLRRLPSSDADGDRQIVLWGPRGVGKTHLLQAVCHLFADSGARVAWVPLKQVLSQRNDLLDGLSEVPVVCVDDIDAIGMNSEWQFALFRLMNQMRDSKGALLMSSGLSPRNMGFLMRDVSSRLLGGTVYQVRSLSDDELVRVMSQYAQAHGYEVSEPVGRYIVSNFPRELTTLTELLDRLSQFALSQQRKITVPLLQRMAAERRATD